MEEEAFGQLSTHELKEGGMDIPVTEDNKEVYTCTCTWGCTCVGGLVKHKTCRLEILGSNPFYSEQLQVLFLTALSDSSDLNANILLFHGETRVFLCVVHYSHVLERRKQ